MQSNSSGVADAVKHTGSQQKLADQLGVSQQVVSQWLRRGWVPLRRAQEIEQITGVGRARLINPRIADLVDLPDGGT
jgi:DNA-binding transcriptional regulator YdaS (Cro superfamily)